MKENIAESDDDITYLGLSYVFDNYQNIQIIYIIDNENFCYNDSI